MVCWFSHAPRGRVSWNDRHCTVIIPTMVTPHVGVWVEIKRWKTMHVCLLSRPTWACELKSVVVLVRLFDVSGHAPRGRVSWNIKSYYNQLYSVLSRPTWACELKCFNTVSDPQPPRSRPTWACELKLTGIQALRDVYKSRPTWACELKCRIDKRNIYMGHVTPHVGVWVEIPAFGAINKCHYVTPHVGVWVEIAGLEMIYNDKTSRPTWACELK